jgi:hypothetical protein
MTPFIIISIGRTLPSFELARARRGSIHTTLWMNFPLFLLPPLLLLLPVFLVRALLSSPNLYADINRDLPKSVLVRASLPPGLAVTAWELATSTAV